MLTSFRSVLLVTIFGATSFACDRRPAQAGPPPTSNPSAATSTASSTAGSADRAAQTTDQIHRLMTRLAQLTPGLTDDQRARIAKMEADAAALLAQDPAALGSGPRLRDKVRDRFFEALTPQQKADLQSALAKRSTARQDVAMLEDALSLFETDMGRYPATEEGLDALTKKPPTAPNWHGPYIRRLPKDPWGNPYVYRIPGRHYPTGLDVSSTGADGRPDSDDDIGNWADRDGL